MLKRKSALFLAAAFLGASPALAQTPAPAALPDADPAIWVVKDPDTTIYLFGTFHALDGKKRLVQRRGKNRLRPIEGSRA